MVLAYKVGKERSFPIVVLLVVVTFGIYSIYYHYKAHNEVFQQFELSKQGRDEGIVWLILGLVLFGPLTWVYQYMFLNNVRFVRERMKLRKGITPGGFLGLTIPGGIVLGVGIALAIIGGIFLAIEPQADNPDTEANEGISQEDADDLNKSGAIMLPIGIVLFLTGMVLQLLAWGRLQASLNELWRSFDRRMADFTGGPPDQAWNAGSSSAAPSEWQRVG